jgi:hypothetical protein
MKNMAQTFLIFDFGSNEEVAQQARLTIDRWRQGFRLDKKLLVKFDRKEAGETGGGKAGVSSSGKKAGKEASKQEDGRILLLVRLDFSDHERLTNQRWLDRIPTETLFKDASPKVIRHADPEFAATAERFDALD